MNSHQILKVTTEFREELQRLQQFLFVTFQGNSNRIMRGFLTEFNEILQRVLI